MSIGVLFVTMNVLFVAISVLFVTMNVLFVAISVLFVTMSVLFVNKNNVMKYRVVGEGRQTAEHAVKQQRDHSRFSP